jgi:hypothetical protein
LTDIGFNDVQWSSAAASSEIAWAPEMLAQQGPMDLRKMVLADKPGARSFQGIHQGGDGYFWRIFHKEMDMVVLPVALSDHGFELGRSDVEAFMERLEYSPRQHLLSIF